MFNFNNANESQKEAISSVNGPLLIIAGPGTGKTFTIVQRAIYMIQEYKVKPENIMIATFTEKAAKEIVTRITNELHKRGIVVNIGDMYIGTFHSICLRIIKENLEHTQLKRNYKILDDFDQAFLVFRNMYKFKNLENFDIFFKGSIWKISELICNYVNILTEELVDPEQLLLDEDKNIKLIGEILKKYKEILLEENLLDFSSIQTEAYELIINNPSLKTKLQEKIQYIMIDEYQDTNYIQEKIIFELAENNKNICVVGDDDQGLYRFRGATIRNILEFPYRFEKNTCKVVSLVTNYRSNIGIVNFYNNWMQETFDFEWDGYRYNKKIIPNLKVNLKTKTVVKLSSKNNQDEWHEKILDFIINSKKSGAIHNYNQIAFLFNSVKNGRVRELANFLEGKGINVYSPRSDMFFEREEVKIVLGILMLLFPQYITKLENEECKYLNERHIKYYIDCIKMANNLVKNSFDKELKKWIKQYGLTHYALDGTTDYTFAGLIYQMYQFSYFREILDIDIDSGVVSTRSSRNLALLSQIIGKFEYLYNIKVLNGKTLDKNINNLFNLYLRLLYDGGITEYEDELEYAPSDCVSFLTIHQSKGMEFPIVFVDSLSNNPRKNVKEVLLEIEKKYYKRKPFEPLEKIKYFDFWRLYYTAFSRAQDLLVLTCDENARTPSKYFREVYDSIIDINSDKFDIKEFDFHEVKPVNIKNTFSFTSHISVYETCPLQYKFYKELEFMPVRASAMVFGRLIHETIEDIHKCALRKEYENINKDNIEHWFYSNYNSISKSEHSYLAKQQLDAGLRQVLKYADRNKNKWDMIHEAEVDVSLVKPEYIIEGKIDLIKGLDDTVEIVDFKSEKKPDLFKNQDRIENYRRQLHIYAKLVEERLGKKVSKMHLYYTGEEDGVPTITFPFSRTAIDATMSVFEDTVKKILNKEYSVCKRDPNICKNCDFRYYCNNK